MVKVDHACDEDQDKKIMMTVVQTFSFLTLLWKSGRMFRFKVVMIGEGGDYGDEGQNDDKADQLLRSSFG